MKIKFVGDEISPSRVPIKELVELLRDLDRGLLEISEEEAEDEGVEICHLALERLEGGSLTLTISDPTSPGLLEDLPGKSLIV